MGAQRRRSPGGRRPGARRRRAAATCGRARIRGVRTRRRARAEAGGHGSDRDRHLWRVAPPGVRACGQELQETEGLGCGRGMKGASAIRSPVKRTLICIVLAAVTCLAAVWAAPRTSASVAEWLQAPPGARRQTARRLTAASTLDAGMRFTMAGVEGARGC